METFIGLSVPLLGTAIGAAFVFMLRDKISDLTNRAMLGFASGVMVAASFWSLLQPAFEQSGEGIGNAWPVLAGFIAGICFLLFLDTVIPHQHVDDPKSYGRVPITTKKNRRHHRSSSVILSPRLIARLDFFPNNCS